MHLLTGLQGLYTFLKACEGREFDNNSGIIFLFLYDKICYGYLREVPHQKYELGYICTYKYQQVALLVYTMFSSFFCSAHVQYNLSGSNPDASFTVDDSNSFFSPYKILPIAQENKYLGMLFLFYHGIICCVYSSESPHQGNSNEYTQHTIIV